MVKIEALSRLSAAKEDLFKVADLLSPEDLKGVKEFAKLVKAADIGTTSMDIATEILGNQKFTAAGLKSDIKVMASSMIEYAKDISKLSASVGNKG